LTIVEHVASVAVDDKGRSPSLGATTRSRSPRRGRARVPDFVL